MTTVAAAEQQELQTWIVAADDPRLSPQVRAIAEAFGTQAVRITDQEDGSFRFEPAE